MFTRSTYKQERGEQGQVLFLGSVFGDGVSVGPVGVGSLFLLSGSVWVSPRGTFVLFSLLLSSPCLPLVGAGFTFFLGRGSPKQ